MLTSKKVGVTLVVIALIAIGWFLPTSKPVTKEVVKETLGAVSTLQFVDSPFVGIGNLQQYHYQQGMTATNTIVCSIKNPYAATSTLLSFTVQATANGLGTQTFDVSTSSTQYGSSSPAFVRAYSTGAGQFSMVWAGGNGTTTTSNLIGTIKTDGTSTTHNIIGPSDWITVRIATTTGSTFSSYLTGTCGGIIQKL